MKEADLRALAHITGGGVPGTLSRVLPDNADAVVDRSTWRPQPIFELVRTKGRIEDLEMEDLNETDDISRAFEDQRSDMDDAASGNERSSM